MEDRVILVNEQDIETGTMAKLEAHQLGLLHRAISVFIFNNKGELLLQQRAMHKYHSAGLWSNTCCSHPFPGENSSAAAHRRLNEEMGITCNLTQAFHFIYKAELDNNLIEYEFDRVFFGQYNFPPLINPEEVMDFKFQDLSSLSEDIQANGSDFTAWLKICLPDVIQKIQQKSI